MTPLVCQNRRLRLLVNVGILTSRADVEEQNIDGNFTTSGKKVDHKADWYVFLPDSRCIDRHTTRSSDVTPRK